MPTLLLYNSIIIPYPIGGAGVFYFFRLGAFIPIPPDTFFILKSIHRRKPAYGAGDEGAT